MPEQVGRGKVAGASVLTLLLCLSLGLAADTPGPGGATSDRALSDALRDAINYGADLFNRQRDAWGCAHAYEGALVALRPLLAAHPRLLKKLDQGLAQARANPDVVARAFQLNRLMQELRNELLGTARPEKQPAPSKKKEPTTPPRPATLWQRLGGEEKVRKVVHEFVAAAAADPLVNFTRGGKYKVDVPKLENDLVDMISQVSGGPFRYTGRNMKQAHQGMHITNEEFDRTAEHLRQALERNGVPADARQELLRIIDSTRADIVEGPPPKAPPKKSPPAGNKTSKANPAATPTPRQGKAGIENWWLKRHEEFLQIARKGDVGVLFLGDSITDGWRSGAAKPTWDKYFAPLKAANFGIGGDRTEHVLWRIQNGELEGIHPKVVVLMIGTNNIYSNTPEQIAEGIEAIVKTLRQRLPESKIVLLGIFPRAQEPTDPVRAKIAQVNERISRLGDENHVYYRDIGQRFLQPDGRLTKEIMPDYLHLSARGYEIWGQAIGPLVEELAQRR
jgi:lysophospholipase L1-like esterase/truncated hemoglobin YjbI